MMNFYSKMSVIKVLKETLVTLTKKSTSLTLQVVNPYPANVENMVSSNNASRWQMGFNSAFSPYPANVENMVSS